jgi:hypothetical protein
MIDRRTALGVVALLLGTDRQSVAQRQSKPLTRRLVVNPNGEEILEVDVGTGAGRLQTIRIVQGAVVAEVTVADLMTALGAKG